MEDEKDLYEQEPVYDAAGNLILGGVTNTTGQSGSSSQTSGQSVTRTSNNRQFSSRSLTSNNVNNDALAAAQEAAQAAGAYMAVPERYTPQPYDEQYAQPSFRAAMQRAEQQRQRRGQTFLDEGDRLRRKGRYLAWTDFLNSLGQIAGQGYAPVRPYDNSRTLKAFDDLDKMRLAAEQVKNDDSLNWIEKLSLQDRIQHNAREMAMAKQAETARNAALKYNAETTRRFAEKTMDRTKASEGSSQSDGTSVNQYSSGTSRSGWSDSTRINYINPDYLSIKESARANAEFMRVGADMYHNAPIVKSEADNVSARMENAFNDFAEGRLQADADGLVHINLGMGDITIPAAAMNDVANSLGRLNRVIMDDAIDESRKAQELGQFVQGIDQLSGGTLSDYYRANGRLRTRPATTATPVTPVKPAVPAQPAAESQQAAATATAGGRWKRNS